MIARVETERLWSASKMAPTNSEACGCANRWKILDNLFGSNDKQCRLKRQCRSENSSSPIKYYSMFNFREVTRCRQLKKKRFSFFGKPSVVIYLANILSQ